MLPFTNLFSLYFTYSAKEHQRIEYIVQGWITDPLSFVVILDRWGVGKSALLQPYDSRIWTLIVLSIPVVSLVLAASISINHLPTEGSKNGWKLCSGSCFLAVHLSLMVWAAMVEQNPKERMVKKVLLVSFRVLFGIWLLSTLVISNAYTGTVISFLCATIMPSNLPLSYKALLDTSLQLVGVDAVYVPPFKRMLYYSEILIVQYLFMSGLSSQASNQSYLYRLHNRTNYVANFSGSKLAYLLEEGSSIPAHFVRLGMNTSLTTPRWSLSKNFAYLSRQSETTRFANLMRKASPDSLVWEPTENSEIISIQGEFFLFNTWRKFGRRHFIIIEYLKFHNVLAYAATFASIRNYFSIFVRAYIHRIVEAGLPILWKQKEEEFFCLNDWEEFECWKEKWGRKEMGVKKCVNLTPEVKSGHKVSKHHHGHSHGSHPNEDGGQKKQPLDLTVLLPTFRLLSYGIYASTFSLLVEFVMSLALSESTWGGTRFMR